MMEPAKESPIFIGGIERSGTSLLYALLASHSKIAMTRRTNLWAYFYNRYGDLSDPQNLENCLADMQKYRRVRVLQPDFDHLRESFLKGKADYPHLFTLLWRQYADRKGKPRWGDKSLNTERFADQIFSVYPQAKIIHVLRDPRDRFSSALKRWKVIRGGVGSGTGMWLDSLKLGERNQRKYPHSYKIVRYETLAHSPEKTLVEICDLIGEEYQPQMLTMSGAEDFRDDGGNSSFQQHEPGTISTRSIGRYSQFLSPFDIAFIQVIAGRKMTQYGYSLDRMHLSPKEKIRFTGLHLPLNVARMLAWRGREAYYDRTGREIPSYRIISETGEMQSQAGSHT